MQQPLKACCFTGHRPERLPWLDNPADARTLALTEALWGRIRESYEGGYTRFLSGMARGIDLLCAELVLRLREEAPAVELIPVLPYPQQAARWRKADRDRHSAILKACADQLIIVSPVYTRSCFWQRNRYLVEHSDKIIGVYDGVPSGGTHQTLDYARQKSLEMELLVPE